MDGNEGRGWVGSRTGDVWMGVGAGDGSRFKVQGSRCLLAITMQEACLTKDKITIQNNNTSTHKK